MVACIQHKTDWTQLRASSMPTFNLIERFDDRAQD